MTTESEAATVQRSCYTCPNYVAPIDDDGKDQVQHVLGLTYGGVGACRARGIPIGLATQSEQAIRYTAKVLANSCVKYGQEHPLKTNRKRGTSELLFIKPSDTHPLASPSRFPSPSETTAPRASSCEYCAFYVSDYAVRDAVGVSVPFCSQKNEVLLTKNFESDAKTDCDMSQAAYSYDKWLSEDADRLHRPWHRQISQSDLTLAPQYLMGSRIESPEVPAPLLLSPLPDPRETVTKHSYHTEAFRKEHGIIGIATVSNPDRPLRRDPKTGLMVPNVLEYDVFDREWEGWTASQRAAIPLADNGSFVEYYHDPDDRMLWNLINTFYGNTDRVPMLQGGPGAGKTQAGIYLAWKMQLPQYTISCTSEHTRAMLLGDTQVRQDPEGMVTRYETNALSEFYTERAVVNVDEFNMLNAELLTSLRSILDGKSFIPDEAKDMVIEKNNYCFLLATGNYAWDAGSYGAQPFADPEKTRLAGFDVQPLPEEERRKVVVSTCAAVNYRISKGTLDKVFALSDKINDAIRNRDLSGSFTLRQEIALGRETDRLTMEQAANTVFGLDLEPKEMSLFKTLVEAVGEVDETDYTLMEFAQ